MKAQPIADFRVESDGNANMVFVDASTNNRVGIGTNAPTKTLDVNGEVKINNSNGNADKFTWKRRK
jgi:hypothetical protein